MDPWIYTSLSSLGWSVLSLAVAYAAVIFFTRCAGLRSFSKMSAADFAMTVAVGSLLASTAASEKPDLTRGVILFAMLFALQWLIAYLRRRSRGFSRLIDNEPLLLMDGATILKDNLVASNVTEDDLMAKLREANVIRLSQVKAVVFEATGDISVLHSSEATELESAILRSVRRSP